MCRFGKCFASFVLALLLSSVSLVPCFAEVTNVNTTDTECSVFINEVHEPGDSFDEFLCPTTNYQVCAGPVLATNSSVGVAPQFWSGTQFLFEEDKTLYWNIYPLVDFGGDTGEVHWLTNNQNNILPDFYVGVSYTDPSVSTQAKKLTVERVALGNENLNGVYSTTYRVTIPSKAPNGNYNNNFRCEYPSGSSYSDYHWYITGGSGKTVFFYIDMFQFVDTSDSALLAVLDNILAEAQEANLNLSNILTACNNIIVELKAIGADTELILECVERMESLLATQLWRLEHIDNSTAAIYHVLAEALKDESDQLSEEAAAVTKEIQDMHGDEVEYQAFMNQTYQDLNVKGFTFGTLSGALSLVANIFSDIWNSFGFYNIIFSFPLLLGIILLAIGRLSRYDTQKRRADRREADHRRRLNDYKNARKGGG